MPARLDCVQDPTKVHGFFGGSPRRHWGHAGFTGFTIKKAGHSELG